MPDFLVDTSALYPLILRLRERILSYADKLAVLDLTVYEVGNVLWKEYKRGRIRDLGNSAALFREALAPLDRLAVDDLEEVLKTAVERDLTFYDASYVYVAEKSGLKLVTEDEEVLEKCSNAVSLDEMLKSLEESK
ncbi:MAG: PIN domain nuclease [Thermoprotei archaeon]|nr:MAG: PIN domain nuclease [Thermoprotei archaeon]